MFWGERPACGHVALLDHRVSYTNALQLLVLVLQKHSVGGAAAAWLLFTSLTETAGWGCGDANLSAATGLETVQLQAS